MKIDDSQGHITFDRLVRADRSLGSDEAITMPKPAEKAIAPNAKGVFKGRTLIEINKAAREAAEGLRQALIAP
ncbi:MAG: hypothetical protein JXJ18_13670 [Rhodobacteraceae bacterium]|nr:hypothetical protein [Paracoccaceae bacterium]